MFASYSPSLQLHAYIYIFSSPLLIPAFTTAIQCPRSSTAASHVVVSIPATFMCVCTYLCSGDTEGLLVPVTSSPYSMSVMMRPLAILWTWPSHRKRRWLSSVYMLKLEAPSSTSVLITLSCQEMSRMRLRHRRWKLFNFFSCHVYRLSRPHCNIREY